MLDYLLYLALLEVHHYLWEPDLCWPFCSKKRLSWKLLWFRVLHVQIACPVLYLAQLVFCLRILQTKYALFFTAIALSAKHRILAFVFQSPLWVLPSSPLHPWYEKVDVTQYFLNLVPNQIHLALVLRLLSFMRKFLLVFQWALKRFGSFLSLQLYLYFPRVSKQLIV